MSGRGSGLRFDGGSRGSRSARTLIAAVALWGAALGTLSAVYGQERQADDPGTAVAAEQGEDPEQQIDPDPATAFLSGSVYLLCAGTSCICAVMLLRGYAKNHVRLLFWSGLCFVGLAVDNVLLYVDLVIVPEVNIAIWRRLPGLVALALLTYGLVWESK